MAHRRCSAHVGHLDIVLLLVQYGPILASLVWLLRSQRDEANAPSLPRVNTRAVAACFALVVLPLSWYSVRGLLNSDESGYSFLARIYRSGRIMADPLVGATEKVQDTPAELFYSNHVLRIYGWFPKFPAGWPLVLSVAYRISARWLPNAVFGTLQLLVIAGIGFRWFSREVGGLAVVLAALSPFYLVNSIGMMSHGEKPDVPDRYRAGMRWRWTPGYFDSIQSIVFHRGARVGPQPSLAKELLSAVQIFPLAKEAVWSWSDPLPFAAEMYRMRVLQLGPYPPPYGGVQTNLVAIRSYLRKQGVTCSVINVTRHRKPEADDVYYPSSAAGLLRLLARLQFDIIHQHFGGMLTNRILALSLACTLRPGVKSVMTFHSGGFPTTPEGVALGPNSFAAFVLRRFDGLIAVNAEIMNFFQRLRMKPERVRLISPYAFLDDQDSFPESLGSFFAEHEPVLISAGQLEPEYDLPLQIDAIAELRKKLPRIGLVLLGSGSIERALRERINLRQCNEHILLPGDIAHVCECTTRGPPDQGNPLHRLMNTVERNHAPAEFVQKPWRHSSRQLSVHIAHLVPLVVSAVEPDSDPAAGLQQCRQRLECPLAIRRVMKHANAVDVVETFRGEWKLEDISLEYRRLSLGEISGRDLCGQAQIDPNHMSRKTLLNRKPSANTSQLG